MKKVMERTFRNMNANRKNGKKALKGFTLVEIIVVLVILAILAAAMIPALTGYIDKAKEKTAIADARSVVTAAQTFASEEYAMNGDTKLKSGWPSDAVKKEIYIGDTNTCHYLTASIGISQFPKDSKNSSELIRYADIAMYSVKSTGKNGIKLFEKELETEMMRISGIESLAQKYITEESFKFAYQPQYCAKTKKLRGFETLLRIREEDRNIVSTQELISVAEKSDIIFRIDEYVLKKALEEFKPNIQKYGDIILSVNISAKHISKKGFPLAVERILAETGFPAEQLEIEITEYCLAGSVDTTIQNMNKLRKLGIKIALDDFGTGYASLSYLSRLPVNLLKIDKSFIDRLSDSSSVDFISAIISMGHILGCEVISEGIESQSQLDIVTEKNCDFIQGFLWGAPLDIKMASELCEKICR